MTTSSQRTLDRTLGLFTSALLVADRAETIIFWGLPRLSRHAVLILFSKKGKAKARQVQ
jgi:hypothetical protein